MRAQGYGDRIIAVAEPSMIEGGDCTAAAEPCWPLAQRALDVRASDGSRHHSPDVPVDRSAARSPRAFNAGADTLLLGKGTVAFIAIVSACLRALNPTPEHSD